MSESQSTQSLDTGQAALGRVYAKALIDAAEQAGNTDLVLEELNSLLDDVLDKVPNLAAALATPRISPAEKISIIDTAFSGKMAKELLNFLKVAAKHKRLDCLSAIRRASVEYYNQLKDVTEVQVRSATPLDDDAQKAVQERLEKQLGGTVHLTCSTDESLLAGLAIRIGDTVYDTSIANRLRRIHETTTSKVRQDLRGGTDRFVADDTTT